MRKLKYLIIGLALLFSATAAADYTQLSSAIDQTETNVTTEIIDAISGMEYDTDIGLTTGKKGDYAVIYAPQTGEGKGCNNYWLAVNDIDVANSNVRICQTHNRQTDVVISQGILELNKGDIITFRQSGDLGIEATQPLNEPLIPSVIISVFKL